MMPSMVIIIDQAVVGFHRCFISNRLLEAYSPTDTPPTASSDGPLVRLSNVTKFEAVTCSER